MSDILVVIAHLLLGGAFMVFGVRNSRNIARLSGVLATRRIPQPTQAARFGVALQFIGGALTLIGAAVPAAGVLGGLAMIVFLVLATTLFHPVWAYSGTERAPHLSATLINSGLVGAFLMIIAAGL